jgi:signal transduction histidine kinase/CheY-like chemotaxis protein/PAS domain-containing protein
MSKKLKFPKLELIILATIIGLLFSLIRSMDEGLRPIDYIQLPTIAILVALFFLKKRISETVLSGWLIFLSFSMSMGLLFTFGFAGNTLLIFMIFSIISYSYYGLKVGIASVALCATIIALFGVANYANAEIISKQFIYKYTFSAYGWLMATVGFVATMVVVLYHIELIHKRLKSSLDHIKKSETRYRTIFEDSPMALMEEDYSVVEMHLRKKGIDSEEKLIKKIEKNPLFLLNLSKKIIILDLNQAAINLFEGKSRKYLIKNMRQTYTPQGLDAFRDGVIAIISEKPNFTCEVPINTLSGISKFAIFRYATSGSLNNIRVSIEDVTLLKQTEMLHRVQKNLTLALSKTSGIDEVLSNILHHTLAMESIDCGSIYLLDKKRDAMVMAKHVGISSDFAEIIDIFPTTSPLIQILYQGILQYPSNKAIPDQLIEEARKTEKILAMVIIPIFHDNKLIAVFNPASKTVNDFSSSTINLLEAIAGITGEVISRTRAEQALLISEERLIQAEKMQAIGLLAGGIAHDFNNQLTPIMGLTELVRHKIKDPELREYLSDVLTSAKHASVLTGQLLAFARKGNYQAVLVDLNMIVLEVVRLLSHSIDKRITINHSLAKIPCITKGDKTQIQNIFLNLALNSRDALPDGGEILFSTRLVNVDTKWCSNVSFEFLPGSYVEICVTDNGTGMSKQVVDHLFEPFFTTKEPGKGTGMGLAAVYGTVKSHHGAITIETKTGRGTTMKVFLPAVANSDKLVSINDSQETNTLKTGHILLIDDEPLIRKAASALLKRMGYRVTTAKGGRSGVEAYKNNKDNIDLVILDMIMPDMGGRDTFRELKKINPAVITLLSSGYSIDGEANAILKEGVVGFLQKPYSRKKLRTMVESALQ